MKLLQRATMEPRGVNKPTYLRVYKEQMQQLNISLKKPLLCRKVMQVTEPSPSLFCRSTKKQQYCVVHLYLKQLPKHFCLFSLYLPKLNFLLFSSCF